VARLEVGQDDVEHALKVVRPTLLRKFDIEIPRTPWKDVGGLRHVREVIEDEVMGAIRNPAVYRRFGITPAKGILLYGPPGTGKTLVAKAIASEVHATFMAVKASDIFSMWYGQSARNVREIFERAAELRPVVLFIDEFETLTPPRGGGGPSELMETQRTTNEVLQLLDGLRNVPGVILVAATNRPDLIDPAMLRPGRITHKLYVGLPDKAARREIVRIHGRDRPVADDVDLDALADEAEGYSGDDLRQVWVRAAMQAMKDAVKAGKPMKGQITRRHLEAALRATPRSVTDPTPYGKVPDDPAGAPVGKAIGVRVFGR
jgi:transitional endoplasmic reticulum ATPase